MNPTELKELKELAQTLSGIADKKSWQLKRNNDSLWEDAEEGTRATNALFHGYEIRLKPWKLGSIVNGHNLPKGREWLRPETWTEERLPYPFRPLMVGEYQHPEDEEFLSGGIVHSDRNILMLGDYNPVRTTRPIEDPYAELKAAHAAGNTIQTIDCGEYVDWPIKGPESWCFPVNEYRIKPDPYAELKAAKAQGKIIEVSISDGLGLYRWFKKENDSWCLPVIRYRIKPDLVNLSREDVPPGSVIKPIDWDNDSYVNYEAVVINGIRMIGHDWGEFCHSNGYIPWDELATDWQINRSLCRGKWDSTAWEPCTKEV